MSNEPSLTALTACLASSCDTACGPACGWLADLQGPDVAAACKQCIIAKACGAVDECWKSATCAAADRCVTHSPALDVFQACYTPGLVDAGPWNPFIAQIGACSTECAFYRDWSCVGHVSVPNVPTMTATITVQLVDLIFSTAPVPNTTIKLCVGTDPSCTISNGTEVTDSNGAATFLQPIGGGGYRGYLDIQNDAGLYPELFFWSFPLSQPTVTFRVGTATTTDINLQLPYLLEDAGTWDTTLGALFISATDCAAGVAASDVQFSIDPAYPNTRFFYSQGGSLSKTADRTDQSGNAVAINVPVGTETLVATPVGFSTPSSRVGFITRPGTLSFVLAPPTP